MRRYLMIGAPVTTVRTPPLLEARLASLGHPAEVEVRHVEPSDLAALMTAVAATAEFDGLLVTMPHKRAMVRFLARVSRAAQRLTSVNTVKRLGGVGLVGAQFDGVALVRALTTRGAVLAASRVALVGVGAAGTAMACALAEHGCLDLGLVDREPGRAAAVAGTVNDAAGRVVARPCEEVVGDYDVLVNASPLGMHATDASPFSRETVARAAMVADIVADPPRTALAGLAREVGVPLVSGRDVVRGQIDPIARWLLSASVEQ